MSSASSLATSSPTAVFRVSAYTRIDSGEKWYGCVEGSGSAAAAEDEDNMELAAAAVAAVAIADEDAIGWMGANGGGSMTLDRFGGHWRLAGPGHWTQLQIEISDSDHS